MRALEHLKEITHKCSAEDQHLIQDRIGLRIVMEEVEPVVKFLEPFKTEEDYWEKTVMKKNMPEVNKHKKKVQLDLTDLLNQAKKKIGIKKTYESNTAEPEEQVDLTPEQQLLLFQVTLHEENLKTEDMKLKQFIPPKKS